MAQTTTHTTEHHRQAVMGLRWTGDRDGRTLEWADDKGEWHPVELAHTADLTADSGLQANRDRQHGGEAKPGDKPPVPVVGPAR